MPFLQGDTVRECRCSKSLCRYTLLRGYEQEVTHSKHVISRGDVNSDATIQEEETADQRKTVGGGQVLFQMVKLMEIPRHRAAVHLRQFNTGDHICHHGDQHHHCWRFLPVCTLTSQS